MPTKQRPPGLDHSLAWWSSTTCRVGTRPPKRSPALLPRDGYNSICPNLYYREGPEDDPDDAAARARAEGGVPDDRLVGDVGGAIAALRALPTSNGKVGVIGYCSGGRQSFLVAISLPVDAAVDCYGAFVSGSAPDGFP